MSDEHRAIMLTRDFQFVLPPALIAQRPLPNRADSRLLLLEEHHGGCRDAHFADLTQFLAPGDLLVFNDTRVLPARLFGHKESGGRVEILVERLTGPHTVLAHVRTSKTPGAGARLLLEGGAEFSVLGRDGELFHLQSVGQPVSQLLEEHGHVPLPPYLRRSDDDEDRHRYQTVYANRDGAVAAPTAGLHFDPAMLARLAAHGVRTEFVTLHVGAGTFQPVRSSIVEQHHMHAERVTVSQRVVDAVLQTRAQGGRVVAVGTTSVRSLETAARGGALAPFEGDTRMFIYPGYRFRAVDRLLTNFHLSGSSLLMLVCAFGGYRRVMDAYRHAIGQHYRFYSYGDAMLVSPAWEPDMPPSAATA